ncbi:bifunctional RNase H/acid phosphatase [Corynebacterium sp. sy039]|uniref:bifunctional RNase H/acid phosphatase n=1 Tax=Corynebacterium sp. sy039 TaxID=2599641 RepID=UPI0011B75142|nr:bifunctional RNase H/acid phosphatase [Corynebacterium sp. sy039]QDZ42984.1 bifunctional RNase H/acid phosphatase [Corynebacterium sp. sy039]
MAEIILETDGGSRGNPGIAGAGSVVIDAASGVVVEKIAYVVGEATNNVAEYYGLLNGLAAAQRHGATVVHVKMDSKLVVEQMTGRWKIKHPDMQQLALQCKKIANSFSTVTYSWIPRKENARADELANQAMDALAAGAPIGVLGSGNSATGGADTADTGARGADAAGAAESVSQNETWHGACTQPTRFILLRHGQTAMSAAKQYSGHSDPELTQLGLQQAQAAAQWLVQRSAIARNSVLGSADPVCAVGDLGVIDAVISSPLQRAQQTATIVAQELGLNLKTEPGLKEMNFGAWEGLSFNQVRDQYPKLHSQWLIDSTVVPPAGESLDMVAQRVADTMTQLKQKYAGKTVVLVSHVTPIKSVVRSVLGAPADVFHRLHLDLAAISIVDFYADGPMCMRLFNGVDHLKNLSSA